MSDVWLITGNCRDYYCEGEHVLAVATSLDRAEALKAEAEEVTAYGRARWDDVQVKAVPADALRYEAL